MKPTSGVEPVAGDGRGIERDGVCGAHAAEGEQGRRPDGDGSGRAAAVVWPSAQPLLGELVRARSDVLFHLEPDEFAAAGTRMNVVDARNSPQA